MGEEKKETTLSAKSAKSGQESRKNSSRATDKTLSAFSIGHPMGDQKNSRRIIAEDPEWSLAIVPLLTDLVVNHIVAHFEHNSSILPKLLRKHQIKVLEKISTNLPITITANLITDQRYWQRCCISRWDLCNVESFNDCWKQMYFERNLEEMIEHYVPDKSDNGKLEQVVFLSAPYIRRLNIKQLLPPVKEPKIDDEISEDASDIGDELEIDHLEFNSILPKLNNIEEFSLNYGVRDCGMNFEWSVFQFTARDCLQLAKSVAVTKFLQIFRLTRSKVDDDKVRVLIGNIIDHPNLIELDLSHNAIGDRGARAIGKLLNNHSRLLKLIIHDNRIRAAGAQAIAHALTKNNVLKHLNLRVNRLGDEGGQAIGRSLLRNNTLTYLNLAANDLSEPTASVFSQVCSQNNTIKCLDLSCNKLGLEGGKTLQEGMDENKTILELDLRLTDAGEESEYCINNVLEKNREKEREEQLENQGQNK